MQKDLFLFLGYEASLFDEETAFTLVASTDLIVLQMRSSDLRWNIRPEFKDKLKEKYWKFFSKIGELNGSMPKNDNEKPMVMDYINYRIQAAPATLKHT